MIRVKQYISEVTVKLDHPLSNINPRIPQFSEMVDGLFARHNLPAFDVTGVVFAPDLTASAYKPPGLLIERKVGAPFSQNRFWSKAPFTTDEHLFALGEFDKLLVG